MPIIQPFPTLPVGVMRLDVVFYTAGSTGLRNSPTGRITWHFNAIDPIPPGWIPVNWSVSNLLWVESLFFDITPFDLIPDHLWGFMQTATTQFLDHSSTTPTGTIQQKCVNFDLCVCLLKKTLQPGRNWQGRAHFLPVPKNFLASTGAFTTAALNAYNAVALNAATGFTINGVRWRPCVFSPQLFGTALIDTVKVLERPTTLYRRRVNQDSFAAPWVF